MPRLSRRTTLGLTLSGAALAGCTSKSDDAPAPSQSTTPTPSATDPDVALAAAALRDEQAALDLVAATLRRHPSLAPRLRSARVAHQSHVELLAGAVPSGGPSATPGPVRDVPSTPRAALATLVRTEQRLSRLGGRRALAARSGPFARVLAAMAAAAVQQAVALSEASR